MLKYLNVYVYELVCDRLNIIRKWSVIIYKYKKKECRKEKSVKGCLIKILRDECSKYENNFFLVYFYI